MSENNLSNDQTPRLAQNGQPVVTLSPEQAALFAKWQAEQAAQASKQARKATGLVLRPEVREGNKIKQAEIRLQISEKGAVSLYGFGRFPITLYAQTWLKAMPYAQQIMDFCREAIEDGRASVKDSE